MVLYIRPLPPAELEFQMFVMNELADQLKADGADVIALNIGIPELPASEAVIRVLSETVRDHAKTQLVHPQGLPELRSAVARYYNEQFHVRVSAEQVVINTGTSPLFRNLFQLLCRPGQEILLPRPYYSLYIISALLADARVAFYDIDPASHRLDFASFRQAFSAEKTAVVVVNNPGNPLGNVLSREDVSQIYEIVADRAYVINDEIYNNTCFYDEFTCPLSYLPDTSRRVTIVTNGFSKGFRLYTKRVGYAMLPDELIMPLRIVQQHTLLTHDPVTQYGMIEALQDLEGPRQLTRLYRDRAEYACRQLAGSTCRPIRPAGGFYVVLDCRQALQARGMTSSLELARDILSTVFVSAVPGTDFGMPRALRLSLCDARFNEAIDRLRRYFS